MDRSGSKKHRPGRAQVRESDPPDILTAGDDGSIAGTVEEVVYRNDLNGYTVIAFGTGKFLVTAVGIMPGVAEGEKLNVWGDWETSPRYGRQFRVTEFAVSVPTGASDLERYLASGAIRGIGPKTAQKIVAEFGEDSADVIENHPDWLAQIPGITPRRAREISAEFREKADVRAVMAFFHEYLGPSAAMKAYRHFGRGAIDAARTTPYRFCDEIDGISFEAADRMAAGLGLVGKDSPERLSSGVRYVLRTLTRKDGHTCLPEDRLVEAAAAELGAGREQTSEAVAELKRIGLLAADTDPDGGGTMVFEREMMENEELIARKLMLLNRGGAVFGTDNVIGLIRKAEAGIGISFDDGQKRAIVSVLSRGVLVLTGGPGTGKTTVINALMTIFESLDLKVALCAPTGRAAKRMTEATGREAKTVHRLLEVSAESAAEGDDDTGRLMTFRRDDRNPLDENAVIIDEASMLDTALCAALLRAVRPGSRVIFIGDADQLPSVGAGNVLGDLIASGTLPVVTLTHIFRQAGESLIVTNAHRINGGLMPDLSVSDRDFFFLGRRTDAEVAETVADLCARRLPAAYGDGETVQVISPSRKGLSGSESLNREIQARLNPEGPGKREYRHGPFVFRRGDRVMQVRNNYMIEWESGGRQGQGIFNGDTGVINDISLAAGYMDIDFDGRNVVYAFSDLDDLEPAYAITVHKSQGSEYPTVVISLGDVPAALRTRSLLYTAVTRAQKRVIIVGFESTVRHMVGNLKPSDRHTGLVRRLREAADRKNAGKQRR